MDCWLTSSCSFSNTSGIFISLKHRHAVCSTIGFALSRDDDENVDARILSLNFISLYNYLLPIALYDRVLPRISDLIRIVARRIKVPGGCTVRFCVTRIHIARFLLARPKSTIICECSWSLSTLSSTSPLILWFMNNKRTYRGFQKPELCHGRVSRAECLHLRDRRNRDFGMSQEMTACVFDVRVLYFIIYNAIHTQTHVADVSKRR